jgi:eukaryotic-like serine/threonine-protein kinase
MSEDGPDPRIGTVLQRRYRIDKLLGVGGMGVVYRGERLGLGRRVAIKFLHAEVAAQPEFVERFEREARAMSKLHHPHCVPVIDFGVADQPYIVMEYVTGERLTELMANGPLSIARAIAIMRQILAALAHAHAQGIVHRDIKPDNVILTEATGTGDHARILDFGLAKMLRESKGLSWVGGVAIGTPSYMSPEQARGEEVDARSDLYSCGVLLYVMLTGTKPFSAKTPLDLLRKHVEEAAPRLSDAAGGGEFPQALEAAVARALAKPVDQRWDSALEFSEALREIEPSGPREVAAAREAEQAPPVAHAPARGGVARFFDVLYWVAVALVIVGAALAYWYLERHAT